MPTSRQTSSGTSKRISPSDLIEMKARGERIAGATAYDVLTGRLCDDASLDFVVVGDSTAVTVLGHDSVIPSTVEQIILFSKATALTCRRPLVVADMPFGSYQVSDEEAVRNAIRFIKEGNADAVKCDSVLLPVPSMASRIRAIVDAGIPTMAHLTSRLDEACSAEEARQFYEDALALEAAGSFAIVLECLPGPVADRSPRLSEYRLSDSAAALVATGRTWVSTT